MEHMIGTEASRLAYLGGGGQRLRKTAPKAKRRSHIARVRLRRASRSVSLYLPLALSYPWGAAFLLAGIRLSANGRRRVGKGKKEHRQPLRAVTSYPARNGQPGLPTGWKGWLDVWMLEVGSLMTGGLWLW